MPILYNFANKKGVFMIPSGGTKSPTPTPPSFNNTKSLLFDGVDEYILAPQPFLNSAYVFSFSFWAKKPTATDQINVGDRISTYQGMWINWYSDGNVYFQARKGANESMVYALSFDTDWHHFVVTFDNGVAKLYIDGSLVDTFTFSASFLPATTGDDFRIGAVDDIYFGHGNIDEVGTWDVALGLTEITELYNSGTPIALNTDTGNYTSSSDLKAWYRNGDNSTYKLPQILMPENSNKNKVSNYSLNYDGVDDSVDVGDFSSYDNGDFSASLWINTSNTRSTNDYVLSNSGSGSKAGIDIIIDRFGNVKAVRNTTTGDTNSGFQSVGLTLNTWHHIAFTYLDATKTLKLYFDGNLINTSIGSVSTNSASTSLTIGSYLNVSNFYLGNIDEVSIYDSVVDVSTLYNGGTPTTITGATAYWKLGEEAKFTDNWLVPNSGLSNYSKFSFAFDGVDDYIDCGNPTELQITGALTISFWFKSSSTSDQAAITKDNLSSRCFGVWTNTYAGANTINFLIWSSGVLYSVESASNYNDGVWHNVICIFTPSTSIQIYVDGSLDGSNTTSIPATIDNDPANFVIGSLVSSGVPLYNLNGNIDEVSIYDSVVDVSSIYNGGEPTTITGSIAHWRMGENASFNTNWTIPDNSDNSNTGTSANMTVRDLKGEAPNYSGSGISNAMTIEDREGDAPNSENNAVSYNMESTDIDNNTP